MSTKTIGASKKGVDRQATRVVELTGEVGFTINLGNYESARVAFTEKVVVNEGYSDEEAYAELTASLEKRIESTLNDAAALKAAAVKKP